METDRDTEIAAIRKQLDGFAALGVTDNAAYLDYFAADALFLPPDGPSFSGAHEALSFYERALGGVDALRVHYLPLQVELEGALAVRYYTMEGSGTRLGSAEDIELRVKYLDVLKKQPNGVWKIVIHMWSPN